MRRVAIANKKGGVGKTTSAVSIGAELAARGERVCVIDLDPQGNASTWLGVDGGDQALRQVLLDGAALADAIHQTKVEGLEVVPCGEWLDRVARELDAEGMGAELVLRERLDAVERGRWDWVLMDCPPHVGLLTVLALVAARELLIPVETHAMPLQGLAQMDRTVQRIRRRLNPHLELLGILPCRYDARTTLAADVLRVLRDRYGETVLPVVRASVRLAEAPSHHQPISVFAPASPAAADYRAVTTEIQRRGRRAA